jgi:hypothetical protein
LQDDHASPGWNLASGRVKHRGTFDGECEAALVVARVEGN